jgi:hypothetical protein
MLILTFSPLPLKTKNDDGQVTNQGLKQILEDYRKQRMQQQPSK